MRLRHKTPVTIVLISWSVMFTASAATPSEPAGATSDQRIKAFDIDFNWGADGKDFASPGTFAQADPKAHYQWYRDLGVNVIQTFCVSCNGYAWYRGSEVAPVQPGLQHDFLKEITELAHRDGVRVMGYFCVGANNYWGRKHPEQSYNGPDGPPSRIHIPLTNEYLDYLAASIKDALTKTDIDGFMIDWVFSPPHPQVAEEVRWLDCEQQMYAELFGRPFPGKDQVDAKEAAEFQRRAVARCWRRIHEAAKSTRPDCVIWLTCFDVRNPQVAESKMFQEVDWLMNEHPDPASLDAIRGRIGPHTQLIQCLCGWGDENDPRRVVGDPKYRDVGYYGYAGADPTTTFPSAANSGNIRNIEILRDVFHDKATK